MLRAFFVTTIITLFAAVSAFAGDPFTVTGIAVEGEGANAIEAQTLAHSDGQVRAAYVLIDRLNARPGSATPEITPPVAAKMMRAMSVADEKRSSSRYYGTITVAFNPQAVQGFAQANGLTLVTDQDGPRLVIPLSSAGFADDTPWFEALRAGGYDNNLAPLVTLPQGQPYSSFMRADAAKARNVEALAQIGRAAGLSKVLLVSERGGGFALTDIALDTGRTTDLGMVQSIAEIAQRTDGAWKTRATAAPARSQTMTVSVLYNSHSEWQRLQRQINNSRMISAPRLDALSKDGALMTLTVNGSMDDLVSELAYDGVQIKSVPNMGVVMSVAGR